MSHKIIYLCKISIIFLVTMSIITLTSDWGTKDYYAAAVKGRILSQLPTAIIVDVTHEIEPFNVSQAGFTLKNCYRCFPPETVHIIAVDSIESTECPHVVVKAEGQYFISTDNGIFSHILDGKYDEAVCIDVMQDSDFFTFATRDRFAKVAVMLAKGEPLSSIGEPRLKLNPGGAFCAVARDNIIEGVVMHIDSYDNLITNISKELFEQERRGRDFTIMVKGDLYTVDEISDSYPDVDVVDLVAIFGTHGYLELALNKAKLASLCGIELQSTIQVVFYDEDSGSVPSLLF